MIIENIKKVTELVTVENVLNVVESVNDKALKATEKSALKGIKKVAEFQKDADKAIKKGLKLSAKKQDQMFDTLDASKVVALKNINKVTKFFSKN